MQIQFTANEQALFKEVAAQAAKMGVPAFAVGGFVRDKILNRPTKDMTLFVWEMGLNWLRPLLVNFNLDHLFLCLKLLEQHK